jgi:Ca2+-binding RTX toxin-like protein
VARVKLFDGMDMDGFRQSDLLGSSLVAAIGRELLLEWQGGRYFMWVIGSGFTYAGPNNTLLTGGTVTDFILAGPYGRLEISGVHADAAVLGQSYTLDDPSVGQAAMLAGDDVFEEVVGAPQTSTPNADENYLARGYGGNDLMTGGGARSIFYGGDGADTLDARAGDGNYLRGDEGNDSIVGAAGFDDINGNMGNDTCVSGGGDDWVVGGRDNDSLAGGAGRNLVYGNLGNDTCDGGAGDDIVRGGQDDDVLTGGAGADFISGDKGSDTLTGGPGADSFHTFGDAGLDRVLDFHRAEGDRVQLDPGTTYSVAQSGADTVISMSGGGQMVLVGVSLASLTPGWIFGA